MSGPASGRGGGPGTGDPVDGPATGRGEGDDHRRTGLAVASIPVLLFVLSAAFIVTRSPEAPSACRHDHPTERVRAWWEEARRHDVSVPGTGYVALDRPDGGGPACIRVGLEERRAQTHLERRFHRLGIPREVVVYEPATAPPADTAVEGGDTAPEAAP